MRPGKVVPFVSDGPVRATDGRVAGRRGQATRRRLLDCTADLLRTSPYREIKVIDIAREAGTSPATFYQYFEDVERAVLALSEELVAGAAPLAELAATGTWRGAPGYQTAHTLVAEFMQYWEAHRALLRVIDMATQEGDLRFQRLRTKAFNPLVVALSEQISSFQRAGRIPDRVEPMAAASVLISTLAHTAAHRYGLEFWGIRTSDVIESVAGTVYWSVTGRPPPA